MFSIRSARFSLLAAAFALPLVGASSGTYVPPVVVVYPLSTSGATRGNAGSEIALLLANRLAQVGGLVVKPAMPGTQRADFLTAATKEGADYYVTGFLAPVGAEESVIVQVVSTSSGTIVYSASTMARTYGDAVGNADDVGHAILSNAGRALASLDEPPPTPPSPTPGPKNGASFNLGKLFGGHKKSKAQPKPSPSATPAAVGLASLPPALATPTAPATGTRSNANAIVASTAASPGALVVATAGDASDDQRARATAALASALSRAGIHSATLPVSAQTVTAHAKDLCAANPGTSTFYAGTLVLGHDSRGGSSVSYDVTAYDCTGNVVRQQHVSEPASKRGGVDAAISTVAERAASALTRGAKT